MALAALPALAAGTTVRASDGWLRFVIPARPAAGYLTLTNTGGRTEVLVGASSPACGAIMIHRSVSDNGSNAMEGVKALPVPANGSVRLAPGGYHLMCMRPAADILHRSSVPLTLTFRGGGRLRTDLVVKNALGR
ncbi:copper chaperone PCu(A)C [Pararhizobium mangrovi]|uniref:copper chaperone PCu(A)C n=1 Tax=Pararhizobium mangrovi TaxID=2590452 RepID=UPI0015E8705A|nr:copper chaperone PCu(A)C [Pararhizobium mangrovi]